MPVIDTHHDIFKTDSELLVCPVNCAGAMGKGLALDFAERDPTLLRRYVEHFPRTDTPDPKRVNDIYIEPFQNRHVALVPTKLHWSQDSQLEWVIHNLRRLAAELEQSSFHTMSIPALGAGLGNRNGSHHLRPRNIRWHIHRELQDCRQLIRFHDLNVPKYYTGVGSRETPADVLQLMFRIGRVMCALGYKGRSGAAPGADTAFWQGAQDSPFYGEVGFVNYLPDATMFNKPAFGNIVPDHAEEVYDATSFIHTYEQAQQLALEARGSFEGLYAGGIKLHTRNAYQVLGGDLDLPSKELFCYAEPVGKRGRVRGGTNTAVMLAQRFNVPIHNLYLDEVRQRVETALDRHRQHWEYAPNDTPS